VRHVARALEDHQNCGGKRLGERVALRYGGLTQEFAQKISLAAAELNFALERWAVDDRLSQRIIGLCPGEALGNGR
jgi:hypothetical protein